MIDKDILEGLAELNETDLKRIKLLVDNKLNLHKETKVSYRTKNIKCGKESCVKCPHGPYWYMNGQKMEKEKQISWKSLSEI